MERILITIGSICTIGFGIWHFFVPAQWNWYSYISPQATELVAAIRAINIFFSLCLVLIGIANLLFIYVSPNRFSLIVILSITAILWGVRSVLQIIFPQGSAFPGLQYGMLAVFVFIFTCFLIPLVFMIYKDS